MSEWPKTIEAFETSDRKLHRSQASADWHQKRLDGAVRANEMLTAGSSLGASLRAGGLLPEGVYLELDEVFATTKLVIEHWQCRTQPGYSPVRVDDGGAIYVYGDAGSWSGPYGASCSPQDVVRYWLDTKRRAA